MRRDTAIRRLRLIAEQCGQVSRIRPVLRSAHVFGEVLDGVAERGVVQVAFVLDLPPDVLTYPEEHLWNAVHGYLDLLTATGHQHTHADTN